MLCSPHALFSFGVLGTYYASRNWQHLILLIYRHGENWDLGMHIIMTQDTYNHSMYIFQQAQCIYNYIEILWIEAKVQSCFEKLLFGGKGIKYSIA